MPLFVHLTEDTSIIVSAFLKHFKRNVFVLWQIPTPPQLNWRVLSADSFWFHAENCKDLIWDSNIFILTRRQKAKYVLRLSILCLYFVFKPHNEHCSRSHLSDYKYERYLHEETMENTFKRSRELGLADSCWFLRLNLILPFTDRNDISVWC